MKVISATGEPKTFSEERLRKSLQHSGASELLIDSIIQRISEELYEGITTGDIYRKAFRMLKQTKAGPAAKYKLKRAIMELGPTGFPFEQFIARLFKNMGYDVKTGQLLQGRCVTHEVDVVARRDSEQMMIECKFHQQTGVLCDVKVPLYISARFRDIEEQKRNDGSNEITSFRGWVVTNTRFTKDAEAFGLCSGLHLLGWDFPAKGSLKELIDLHGLHPITSLTTLTKHEKQLLLDKNIVLCSELKDHHDLLGALLSIPRLEKVMAECRHLCRD